MKTGDTDQEGVPAGYRRHILTAREAEQATSRCLRARRSFTCRPCADNYFEFVAQVPQGEADGTRT